MMPGLPDGPSARTSMHQMPGFVHVAVGVAPHATTGADEGGDVHRVQFGVVAVEFEQATAGKVKVPAVDADRLGKARRTVAATRQARGGSEAGHDDATEAHGAVLPYIAATVFAGNARAASPGVTLSDRANALRLAADKQAALPVQIRRQITVFDGGLHRGHQTDGRG